MSRARLRVTQTPQCSAAFDFAHVKSGAPPDLD
jgi:hypothetical protein